MTEESTFDPNGLSPDILYAKSYKYSNALVILLPLPSGKVAIFDNSRALRDITNTPLNTDDLINRSTQFAAELDKKSREIHAANPTKPTNPTKSTLLSPSKPLKLEF